MYIFVWIVAFMILVILHELWHFVALKKFWVKVYEFGIWIPPKLKTIFTDKQWTEYTINALPLGWFVRPKWEDSLNTEELVAEDSFYSKKLYQKIIILLWWVFVNLVVAFVLFTISFWQWIKPLMIVPDNISNITKESFLFPSYSYAKKIWVAVQNNNQPLKVEWVIKTPETLSSKIEILTWDIIYSINGHLVTNENISQILSMYIWKQITIVIKRNWKFITQHTTCQENQCLLGVFYDSNITYKKLKLPLAEAMKASLKEIKTETIMTFQGLKLIFEKLFSWKVKEAVGNLAWPAAATAIWKKILQKGFWEYVAFIASISLALAILNLLPIPALDGWRAVVVFITTLLRIPVTKYIKVENYVNIAMFILLMWIWIIVLIQDIQRFY